MRIYSISKNIFGRPQGLAKRITTWSPPWLTAIHPSPTLIEADQCTATPRRVVLAMKGNIFHQNITDACLQVHAKRCSALTVMRWYSSSQDKGQKNMLERPGKKRIGMIIIQMTDCWIWSNQQIIKIVATDAKSNVAIAWMTEHWIHAQKEVFTLPPPNPSGLRSDTRTVLGLCSDTRTVLGLCSDFFWLEVLPN